jgi:hypothetical protein
MLSVNSENLKESLSWDMFIKNFVWCAGVPASFL